MLSNIINIIASKTVELWALKGRFDTLQKSIRDHPPKTAEEYIATARQVAEFTDSIAALAREILTLSNNNLTDADAAAIQAANAQAHATNQVTTADPRPAQPPPPPTAFPYFTVIDFDPRGDTRLSGAYKLYQSSVAPTKFYVTDGKVGGGRPKDEPDVQPLISVNGQDVGGGWLLIPR